MRKYLKLSLILLVTLVEVSCNNSKPVKTVAQNKVITVLTPQEFKNKLENNTLIDVRTSKEFQQGHLEKAVNIDFYNNTFLDQFAKYNKTEPIFIYCHSGGRASSATKKLTKLGFTKIYDLQGGITNWNKNKLKTIKQKH